MASKSVKETLMWKYGGNTNHKIYDEFNTTQVKLKLNARTADALNILVIISKNQMSILLINPVTLVK